MSELNINVITKRMCLAVNVKNTVKLAEYLGYRSTGTISGWKKAGAVPDSVIAKISEKTSIHFDWLKTGEGEMRPGEATSKTSLSDDLQTMRLTIQAVEEYLQAEGKQLPPAKKSELITTLYEMFIEDEDRKVDKKTVAKLIKLAS